MWLQDQRNHQKSLHPRLNKTSRSGFVYCRYFRPSTPLRIQGTKEKVGGKRGLTHAFGVNVPIILQA